MIASTLQFSSANPAYSSIPQRTNLSLEVKRGGGKNVFSLLYDTPRRRRPVKYHFSPPRSYPSLVPPPPTDQKFPNFFSSSPSLAGIFFYLVSCFLARPPTQGKLKDISGSSCGVSRCVLCLGEIRSVSKFERGAKIKMGPGEGGNFH